MKNKRIIIIIVICILILFVGFLVINRFVINGNQNNTDNGTTIKDFTFHFPDDMKFKMVDEHTFELKTNSWTANLEILYDERDLILSYPGCTKIRLTSDNYKTGELKKNEGYDRNYISFTLVDETNNENNIISYYRIDKQYIVYIDLINKDNSFNEEPLKDIYKALDTAKFSGEKKSKYHSYLIDFYHQCHDIEELDKE